MLLAGDCGTAVRHHVLILCSSTVEVESDFRERGFALHFDLVTREVELAVLALGRVFGQVGCAVRAMSNMRV